MLGNGWTYSILGRTEESVDQYTAVDPVGPHLGERMREAVPPLNRVSTGGLSVRTGP